MTDRTSAVAALIASFPPRQDSLLPLLHVLQDHLGHIPPAAVPEIARALNLSRAEVHGVITYYSHFRQTPAQHVVRVCCAEGCQANGAEALAAHAQRHDGGTLTVEPVYCLGLCSVGPAVQVDETTLHAHVTPEKFDALIAALAAKS